MAFTGHTLYIFIYIVRMSVQVYNIKIYLHHQKDTSNPRGVKNNRVSTKKEKQ